MQYEIKPGQSAYVSAKLGQNSDGQFSLRRTDDTEFTASALGFGSREWSLAIGAITATSNPGTFWLDVDPLPQAGGTVDLTMTVTQNGLAAPVFGDPGDDPALRITNPAIFKKLPSAQITRIPFSIYVRTGGGFFAKLSKAFG